MGLGPNAGKCKSIPSKIQSLSNIVKIACSHHSAALSRTGELYFWGTSIFGSLYEPKLVMGSDIVDMSIGGCFGIA